MQATHRPSPALLAQRRVGTVPFEIKSQLKEIEEAIEKGENEGADVSELRAAAERMKEAGMIAWHVKGERLERLGAVEGHRVASLQEDLIQRFIVDKEPLFGFDVEDISRNQCRSVAIVCTAIRKIEGGELYNAEELLSMPFTALSDLWLALLAIGNEALQGNATTETKPD